jgi:hypothetical protein
MDEHLRLCLGEQLSAEELSLVSGARQLVYTWKARRDSASLLFAPADAQGVMRGELTDRALAFFRKKYECVYCMVGWLHEGEYRIFSSMDVRYTTSVVKETPEGELEIFVPDFIKANYFTTLLTSDGGRKIELQMPAASITFAVVDAKRARVWAFNSVDRITEFVLDYDNPTGLSVFTCIGDNAQVRGLRPLGPPPRLTRASHRGRSRCEAWTRARSIARHRPRCWTVRSPASPGSCLRCTTPLARRPVTSASTRCAASIIQWK